MIANLMALSVRARWMIIALVLIVSTYGAWQLTQLPIDAVPDITNKQVQINTQDPSLSPIEIEKRVTFPVETAMAGIPGLHSTRSLSRNGFSQVTLIFEEKVDLYFARQQVSERLVQAQAGLPEGVQPRIGPVTTGLGEVFMYAIDYANPGGRGATVRNGQPGWQSDGSFLTPEGDRLADDVSRAAYLRTVQDWIIAPQLRTVNGVAGVDTIGGFEKQYVVEPDPTRLAQYGVSFSELAEGLEAANLSIGANFVERGGEAYLVRADARIRSLNQIQEAIVATRGAVARPWPFVGGGLALFAVAGVVFTMLGQEFIPTLDERNLALASQRVPSTAVEQSLRMQVGVERAITALPEVELMFSKTGTAEVATDPMPANMSDGYIILKPQDQWPDGVHTKEDVIERVEAAANAQVGQAYELSQPIELRFNELIAGVRGDVAIKIYGDDLDKLTATANRIAAQLNATPGAADVKVEQTDGAPSLDVNFDRAAIARFGLTVEEVADTVAAAMGGREAGQLFEGDRRFDVVVRVPNASRPDLDAIGAIPVMLPEAEGRVRASVPLRQVASFRFAEGLNQISRENGKRRVVVQANVRGRDVGSFVNEATPKVEAVPLPAGSWIEWGGQFQNLKAASDRLALVVPICFLAVFAVLFLAVGTLGRAVAVFLTVPLGLAGGVFALALTGISFSVSAAVGFICLAGVAVLNGLVVMSSIRQRLEAGMELSRSIIEGCMERVRPVIMTGLVPAIGFVPMALAHGTGAEVQKPLAMVVIGGLITATLLTLLVLPAMSRLVLGFTEGRRPASVDTPAPEPVPAE